MSETLINILLVIIVIIGILSIIALFQFLKMLRMFEREEQEFTERQRKFDDDFKTQQSKNKEFRDETIKEIKGFRK